LGADDADDVRAAMRERREVDAARRAGGETASHATAFARRAPSFLLEDVLFPSSLALHPRFPFDDTVRFIV
jgi:hypothetical protein